MKLLFLSGYFYPENVSYSNLEKDIVEALIEDGNEIRAICPVPTRGISDETAKKYRRIKYEELYGGRVQIKRFWAPRERKNPLLRALRYFWCNLRQYQIGRKYKDTDLIFSFSTPPTQGLFSGKIAKKINCSLLYSIQDIFPDSLVTTNLSKEGSLLWKIGRYIEKRTYSLCSVLVVISESMKRNLLNKGVDENKIAYIPNWIDTDKVKPVAKSDNKLFDEFNIDIDKFTVVYAGNLGTAQGTDVIIRAAELLKDESDILFIIFGSGAKSKEITDMIAEKQLTNVTINPLLSQDRVSEVYSLGDVALITCKPGVGNSGMPSKTWGIMACNTPIIASFDTNSELADIINKANAGICVNPGDADELSKAILNMKRTGKSTDIRAENMC